MSVLENPPVAEPEPRQPRSSEFRFGPFVLDTANSELRKAGVPQRLQGQPMRVLSILVERAGELVSREDLRLGVWGNGTTVDFDHGLDVAINKVREVLGDTASDPKYVETLARRGYRFVGRLEPVSAAGLLDAAPRPPFGFGSPPAAVLDRPATRNLPLYAASTIAVAALAALLFVTTREPQLKPARIREITHSGRVFPGLPLQESLGQTATDGTRLFFCSPLHPSGMAKPQRFPSRWQTPLLFSKIFLPMVPAC
jgi:DNA-binding winged helix-turn-helix (wHTH) protein